jgi:hypothetical protein
MSERLLSDLPGYQPLNIEPLDEYIRTQRGGLGDEATVDLLAALWQGGLPANPDKLENTIEGNREWAMRQQKAALYVGELVGRLIAATDSGIIITPPVAETGLTNLFRDTYGVDLDPYTEQSTYQLAIKGVSRRGRTDVTTLDYMAVRERRNNIFWQLILDGLYGSVNMTCTEHDFGTMPLRGEGNIALIPGVREALAADVAFIEESAA